jgi:RimJ/RimL family protein N-acetyltransferase
MAEYFRRYPPAFTWLTPSTFIQVMASSYVVQIDDKAVGLLSLGNFDNVAKKVEIGIALDPALGRRARFALEAFDLALDYVFNYLGFNRAFCLALESRADLTHILVRGGFKEEGLLRDNIFFAGRFQGERVFGINAAEYAASSEALRVSRV